MFLISNFCFAQNPLADILPVPVENKPQQTYDNQQKPTVVKFGSETRKDTVFELSENAKNYQHEQVSEPLKDFKKKELAFNNYDATPITAEPSKPEEASFSVMGVLGFLLLVVIAIITYISLPRSNTRGRRRRY